MYQYEQNYNYVYSISAYDSLIQNNKEKGNKSIPPGILNSLISFWAIGMQDVYAELRS